MDSRKDAAKDGWFRRRTYLHFDRPLGFAKARQLATDPKQVAHHAFYPLISYEITSKKIFRDNDGHLATKSKPRRIGYAAHLDACIYSYYAKLLSEFYEKALAERGLSSCVLAFRPLGKSNIDFAAEAFGEIAKRPAATAVAMDVSGFFDHLDHVHLKKGWARLLGTDLLPSDHYAVYKSVTRYSTVDKRELYEALGISPHNPRNGRHRVCTPSEFRSQARAAGLVQSNTKSYGIPQGTPISAVLSNLYMLDFDAAANHAAQKIGGIYMRYCDDMLFIVPPDRHKHVAEFVRRNLKKIGLDINTKKTEIRTFRQEDGIVRADKPLQYLGFTFDGERILVRSASLARYSQKMKKGVRLAKATMRKRNAARMHRGQPPRDIFRKKLYQRYSYLGRSNFVSYGYRAAAKMQSPSIRNQLKKHWKRLLKEIED